MRTFLPLCSLLLLMALGTPACKKDRSCENCPTANKPPVARAGTDQVVKLPTDSTLLDGRASSDPDGKVVAYRWRQIEGPSASLVVRADSSVTRVRALVPGRYAFELKVTDDKGLSAQDTVVVDVQVDSGINHPPVARAGNDQSVTLPANSVRLDGSGSSDPEDNITAYAWTKVSGPAPFQASNTAALKIDITSLVEGGYLFELIVTDAGGLFSADTVQVTVHPAATVTACDQTVRPRIQVKLVDAGTLSQPMRGMAVTAAGNKILFAGGSTYRRSAFALTSRVDIYDLTTQRVSTAELSEARYLVAAAASGNKVFFAGGEVGDGTWPVNTVDIYDVASDTWSKAALSVAGHGIAAAAVGNKVLFAGGDGGLSGPRREYTVDIYDLTAHTWSAATLSEAKRGGLSAVAANNKIYVAGGEGWPSYPVPGSFFASKRIDVYDPATNSWSTDVMLEGKQYLAAVAAGSKIFWAGGITGSAATSYQTSCVVEIKDVVTGQSSVQQLSAPAKWYLNSGQYGLVKDSKVIFYRVEAAGHGNFDIYDLATNSWSVGVLPVSIDDASIIAVNGTIYLAGGWVNGAVSDKIWKVEF